MPQFGSISVFNSDGSVVPLPQSFKEAVTRPQGMAFDSEGNLWACSWGSQTPLPHTERDKVYSYEDTNSAVVCFLKDSDWTPVRYELGMEGDLLSSDYQPFDLVIDSTNNVFLAAGGNEQANINSSVWKFKLDETGENPLIQRLAKYSSDQVESYKQIILNQNNEEVLVAGESSNQIIRLTTDLEEVEGGNFSTNIFNPWGICQDAAGTLFVANFSDMANGEYGVAVIKNEDDLTTEVMTLPSRGNEVRLANGMPLYGNVDKNPCYQPLMRMTCNVTDKVGNLWVTNNWKPSAKIDLKENPGGDGIVIFVGVAKPLA